MGRPLLLLCVLAVLTGAHFVFGYEWKEPSERKCEKMLLRKEWRTLTFSEREEWIGAVKCLANIKHPRLSLSQKQTVLHGEHSLYDDFSYAHAVMDGTAHFVAAFLPWHRHFLHLFDQSLRTTCSYTGPTPYWDWSLDHTSLFTSPVFDPHPIHGFGGSGDCSSPEADCVVQDGAFAPGSQPEFRLSWPVPHYLRRNLTLLTGWFPSEHLQNLTLTPSHIHTVLHNTTGDFFRFQYSLAQMHNHVHNLVEGDLAGDCPRGLEESECAGVNLSFTPNDPLFWLHHAQLDRLWSEWQRLSPLNEHAFSGVPLDPKNMSDPRYDVHATKGDQMAFDRLSVPLEVKEVFDHEKWPFCYRYAGEKD